MPSLQPLSRRRLVRHTSAAHGGRVPPATSNSRAHSELVRTRGGHIAVPGKLTPPVRGGTSQRLTKLLLNVNIQRSLGPIQVVISPEKTVRDLIKASVEIHVTDKRRPLLTETNTWCFELHYSEFSLESLKPEEKLINLGSRNFFLCPKPTNSSCSDEAKQAANSVFPLTNLMDFLL